ncbi:hypothetical protein [Pseudodesulfovibrio indicus]|uniref:Uncharacterized protein n=1 Tax=Pseudodesulfovibrio indicus TaxID=1716143 RepID=A0A126QR88_9BACT|nr:hypothetical protein [Pseudodesulfovibrio indicus]AMK12474.1 hypothetical protein AWY79_15880 [Pseudodesulfovibrio indicus]TDT90779.1 hypothetical protein EDC59_102209 [Pseudodesulfovibrio indicus]
MLVYEIVYAAPLNEEISTHLDKVVVLANDYEQMGAYRNLVRGREVSVTLLASDQSDHLPRLVWLDALEAQKAERKEPGEACTPAPKQ